DEHGRVVGASAIARDVTRRRAAEEAHARLAAIVASSSDAIVGVDPTGTVSSWNPGARRLFGYHQTEAIGRSMLELLAQADATRWAELLEQVGGGQQDAIRETLHVAHRDGQ